jgi:hypothetical protein
MHRDMYGMFKAALFTTANIRNKLNVPRGMPKIYCNVFL